MISPARHVAGPWPISMSVGVRFMKSAVFGAPRTNANTRQSGPIGWRTLQKWLTRTVPPGAIVFLSTMLPRYVSLPPTSTENPSGISGATDRMLSAM